MVNKHVFNVTSPLPQTILLIAQNDDLVHAVKHSLSNENLHLCLVSNHLEAVSQELPIDLILLDCSNKTDLSIHLANLETLHTQLPFMPIIVIGNIDDDTILTHAFEQGVVDILSIPLRPVLVRQRIQHALRLQTVTSEGERLKSALEAANDGLWDWDMTTGKTYYNPRWSGMLGYTPEELSPSVDTWRKLCHPDDIAYVEEKLQAHFDNDTPYEIEHRLRTKSGDWKWIRAFGKVVKRDEDNSPLRMIGTHIDIDERRRIRDMLRENQTRLRQLIENVTNIIYSVSFEGIITYATPNWTEYLGQSLDSVIEYPIADFIHPDDLMSYETFLNAILNTGDKQLGVKFRLRNNHGDWLWFTSSASLAKADNGTPLYYVGAMHDIHQQHQVKEALAETEQRYRIISNTISDYAYSYQVNPDGTMTETWSTDAFHKITGYRFQDMDENDWQQITHPDDLPIIQKRFEKLLDGEADVSEFRIITKSGKTRWLADHAYPVKDETDGHIVRIYGAAQDITRRKHFEQQLQAQTKELRARNEELDAFSYSVAHDLKNPIATMMGFTSLILNYYDRMPPEEVRENLQLILEGGYKLKSIINALLLLAGVNKIEQPAMQPLDMLGIIEQAQHRLTDMSREHNAQISLPDGNLPIALGYAPWVEEIWANYLSNAIKYGGTPPVIQLGAEYDGNGMCRFWVRDNGRGLTQAEQQRLFIPFSRLNQAKIEGHGLGLSVVHRIVEKLGGEVSVVSGLGKGSEFSFTLPSHIAHEARARA